MALTNILIAAKEPAEEFLKRKNGNDHVNNLPNKEKNRIIDSAKDYYKNLSDLEKNLKQFDSIEYSVKRRKATNNFEEYSISDFLKADIVISFGGDGEAIDIASHINKNNLKFHNPLLWIEKADKYSVGALSTLQNLSYYDKIKSIENRDFNVEKWTRAKGVIYEKEKIVAQDLALNEIAFGDLYMMGMARYVLHHGFSKEYQKSSGGMISTNAGLFGWLMNVRPSKKIFENMDNIRLKIIKEDDKLDFENDVLEYRIVAPRILEDYSLTEGTFKGQEKIIIESQMYSDGIVTFDGSKPRYDNSRCHEFNVGRRLEVSVSDEPINVIRFNR